MPKTHYETLKIEQDATTSTINVVYRAYAKQFHPVKAIIQGLDLDVVEKLITQINTAKEKTGHAASTSSSEQRVPAASYIDSVKSPRWMPGFYGLISTYPIHKLSEKPIVVQEPNATTFHLRRYEKVLWTVKNYGSPKVSYEAAYFDNARRMVITREIGELELKKFNAAIIDFLETKKASVGPIPSTKPVVVSLDFDSIAENSIHELKRRLDRIPRASNVSDVVGSTFFYKKAQAFDLHTFLGHLGIDSKFAEEISFRNYNSRCILEFPAAIDSEKLDVLCNKLTKKGIGAWVIDAFEDSFATRGPRVQISKNREEIEAWMQEQDARAKPRA